MPGAERERQDDGALAQQAAEPQLLARRLRVHLAARFPADLPDTPNGPFDYDYRSASFKLNGTYNATWGINLSPVFRFQAGANFARTLSVSAPASCACSFSAARGGSLAAKVRLFLDGFNLANAYAGETIVQATGTTYLQPTAILGPRTGRVGVRFVW